MISMSGSAARSCGELYALVVGGRLYVLMADWAAGTLLFSSAVMVNLDRPVGLRRKGRCADEAQDVVAEEERLIRAVGTWLGTLLILPILTGETRPKKQSSCIDCSCSSCCCECRD